MNDASHPSGSPLLAGLITGILLAVVWVLVVVVTHNGVGLAAWGVGGLIGIAVAKSARPPSVSTGTLAAVLTVGTVLLVKVLVLVFALRPMVQDEIMRDPEAITTMFMVDMTQRRAFSPELQASLDSAETRPHDGAPPAERFELSVRMLQEARTRAAAAAPVERKRVVRANADDLLMRMGFWPLVGWWDILWLGFGVATAWKLGTGKG